MDATRLKVGMKVRNGKTIVKVTQVPHLDKHRECFFSGKVVSSDDPYYKDHIGKNFSGNWNSAFSYPA